MAGTVTKTETTFEPLKQIKFAWTSANTGAADSTTVGTYTGAIIDAVFVPGTPTPTTAYDVVITDTNSVDVLNALGADLSSAATVHKTYKDGLGAVVASKLTLAITNAGDSKQGTIILTLA